MEDSPAPTVILVVVITSLVFIAASALILIAYTAGRNAPRPFIQPGVREVHHMVTSHPHRISTPISRTPHRRRPSN